MNWNAVWRTISSWPAAIAAGVRAIWPQIKTALIAAGVAYADRQRQDKLRAQDQIADSAAVDDIARRARNDPDYVEQLRRKSGKPTTNGRLH